MPQIVETIPPHLAPQAEAARAWFSSQEGAPFKLTGIVDPAPPEAVQGAPAQDLQLILCGTREGQEVCLRESFQVARTAEGFEIAEAADAGPAVGSPAPHLDPPAGERAGWLDAAVARHDFVLLLFYRGFW